MVLRVFGFAVAVVLNVLLFPDVDVAVAPVLNAPLFPDVGVLGLFEFPVATVLFVFPVATVFFAFPVAVFLDAL